MITNCKHKFPFTVSGSEKCQEPNTDASVTENAENGKFGLSIEVWKKLPVG